MGSFNLFLNLVFIIGEQNPAKISGALEDCNLCNLGIWGDSLLSGHEGWVQRLPTGEASNFGKLKPKHAPSPPEAEKGPTFGNGRFAKHQFVGSMLVGTIHETDLSICHHYELETHYFGIPLVTLVTLLGCRSFNDMT